MVRLFKRFNIWDTNKTLLILGVAILLTVIENTPKDKIEIAGLLGIMTVGFIILEKLPKLLWPSGNEV